MKKYISLSLIILAGYYVNAQKAVQSFSLSQAVSYARENNFTQRNTKLDEEMAQKKVKEVMSAGLPQVNANANVIDNIKIPTQVAPNFFDPSLGLMEFSFGVKYQSTASVSASQLLFDGSYFLGLKAAKEFVNLARINTRRTAIETEVNVTKAYYNVLITKERIGQLDNSLKTLDKTLSDMKASTKVGLTEQTDLDRLEIQYSSTMITKEKTMDGLVLAYMLLKLQMGMTLSDSVVLTDNLEDLYKANLVSADALIADYGKRADFQMLEQQMKLQEYDRKRHVYGYVPTLNASFSHMYNSFGLEFGDLGNKWYPATALSLHLNVPIFDGLRKSALIQQSKVTMKKLENDKKNLQNLIDNEVTNARLMYQRTRQQLEIQRRNMALAEDVYKRTNIKFQNGLSSSLELTTSEKDLKTAQVDYLVSVYDMLAANIELKKALGVIQ